MNDSKLSQNSPDPVELSDDQLENVTGGTNTVILGEGDNMVLDGNSDTKIDKLIAGPGSTVTFG